MEDLLRTQEAAEEWLNAVRGSTIATSKTVKGKRIPTIVNSTEAEELTDPWALYLKRMHIPLVVQRDFCDPIASKSLSVKTPWEVLDLHCCEVSPEDVSNYYQSGFEDLNEMQWLRLHNINGRMVKSYRKNTELSIEEIMVLHKEVFPVVASGLSGSGLSDRDVAAVTLAISEGMKNGIGERDATVFYSAMKAFIYDVAGTAEVRYGRVNNVKIDTESLEEAIAAALFIIE